MRRVVIQIKTLRAEWRSHNLWLLIAEKGPRQPNASLCFCYMTTLRSMCWAAVRLWGWWGSGGNVLCHRLLQHYLLHRSSLKNKWSLCGVERREQGLFSSFKSRKTAGSHHCIEISLWKTFLLSALVFLFCWHCSLHPCPSCLWASSIVWFPSNHQ